MNSRIALLPLLVLFAAAGCGQTGLTAPVADEAVAVGGLGFSQAAAPKASCWGQASAVFAQMGEMGPHSSQQSNPRAGLRNLARLLADAGIIPDDTMSSLGVFVANELGLTIAACM